MMSAYDFLPDDCGIPYVDVTTEAGDFMYFPAHWWHQVKNEEDGVGVAFGFRPQMDLRNALKDIAMPLLANKGLPSHRFTFIGGLIKSAIKKKLTGYVSTNNDKGGVFSRTNTMWQIEQEISKHVPGWTWDAMSIKNGNCVAEE